MFNDLRDFISDLERRGELRRIKFPVSADLEIAEITRRIFASNRQALLFENVCGYSMPVLVNQFATENRLSRAFNATSFDAAADSVRQILNLPFLPRNSVANLFSSARKLINFPRYVKNAPCQECLADNLDFLPILKTSPLDAGAYITLPVVITKNPITGKRNCGMYRLQKFDNRTLGMHWHIHKNAAEFAANASSLEVAVAIGSDPVTTFAASAPLPRDLDELLLAGFLRGASVPLVQAKSVDLQVPATAEVIIEGFVNTHELRLEGPFGDHTGFYSAAAPFPVLHVTCITHRRNPIYSATVLGSPPQEDSILAKASERLFLPVLQMIIPEILDINMPVEGAFHNICRKARLM